MDRIGVGLVGIGTVGGGVVRIFDRQGRFFDKALGAPLQLCRIADTDPRRFAQLPVGDAQCSENADDILNDDEIHIVVELVGGTGFARTLVLEALKRGKHVVTANKALIAEHGPELFDTASQNNVSLFFEAAVGGGMPVIKTLRESLIGNEIESITCIINGTCNYILTRMLAAGLSFDQALGAAQQSGFAEADPTLDVGGGDTGHKVAIMASLAYGKYVPFSEIALEGIADLSPEDIRFADELGYTVKLLGIVKAPGENGVDVRVHPAMLPRGHILSSVANEFNAVLVRGDAVGDILLYGKGAGEMPTASAVVSDLVDCGRDLCTSASRRIAMDFYRADNAVAVKPITDIVSRYYLRFMVVDCPGVLASISTIMGKCNISIASVMQKEGASDQCVPVIFLTHAARERDVRQALEQINTLDFIREQTRIIRIED